MFPFSQHYFTSHILYIKVNTTMHIWSEHKEGRIPKDYQVQPVWCLVLSASNPHSVFVGKHHRDLSLQHLILHI